MKRRARNRDRYVPLIDSLEERSLMSGMRGFDERAIPFWADAQAARSVWMAPTAPPPSLAVSYQAEGSGDPLIDLSDIAIQPRSDALLRTGGSREFVLVPSSTTMLGEIDRIDSLPLPPRPTGPDFFVDRRGGGPDRLNVQSGWVTANSDAGMVQALMVSYQPEEMNTSYLPAGPSVPNLPIGAVAGVTGGVAISSAVFSSDARPPWIASRTTLDVSFGERTMLGSVPLRWVIRLPDAISISMDSIRVGAAGVPAYGARFAQFLDAMGTPLSAIGLPPTAATSFIISAADEMIGSIRQMIGLERLMAAQSGIMVGVDGRLTTSTIGPLHDLRFLETGVILVNSNWTTPVGWPVQAPREMGNASEPDTLPPQAPDPATAATEQSPSPLMAGLITEIPILNDLVFGPLDVSQTLDQLANIDEAGWNLARGVPLLVTAGLLAIEVRRRRRGRKLTLATAGFARDRRSSLHGFS